MSFTEKREYDLFLEVPFSEKGEAKQAGAWWSPDCRKWFVPARRSVMPFAKWLPAAEKADYEIEMQRRLEQKEYHARQAEKERLPPRWTDPHEILRRLRSPPVFKRDAFCIGCDSRLSGWFVGSLELRHQANTDYGPFHRTELDILEAALDAGLPGGPQRPRR